MARSARLAWAGILTGALALTGVAPANAAVTTSSDPQDLADASFVDPAIVVGGAFEALPPEGTPHGVGDEALATMPRHGTTFSILTSGNAEYADDPNDSGGTGDFLGGSSVRGDTDFDASVLRIDIDVPGNENCLRLDFQFLSDEYPEWVGSSFNDAFVAEMNTSTWTTSGSVISSPDNFALGADGEVISINSTGVTGMTADAANGTTYDGATSLLRAFGAFGPGDNNGPLAGDNSLYLSIFDQGDGFLDSAVFVDAIAVAFVPDPATQCLPGAKPPSDLVAEAAIAEAGPDVAVNFPAFTATLTESFSGSPLAGKTVEFFANDSTSLCSATTGSDGVASCEGILEQVQAAVALGYTAVFAGDEAIGPSSDSGPLVRVAGTDLP